MLERFSLWTPVAFLAMIVLLVAVHELGHYLFARLFNMGVEEFALGFGRPLLGTYLRRTYDIPVRPNFEHPEEKQGAAGISLEGKSNAPAAIVDTPTGRVLRETTNFTVRAWPLGGFVRIKGMALQEDGGEADIPGGFYSKPAWQRFVVLLAGPVFSLLLGVVLLAGLYLAVGMDRPNPAPILGAVGPNMPAEKAGIRGGDTVLSMDGSPVVSFYDMVLRVRNSQGKPLKVVYRHGSEEKSATLTPELSKDPIPLLGPDLEPTSESQRVYRLGASPAFRKVTLSAWEAVSTAARVPVDMVQGIAALFARPSEIEDNVGGPATIAVATNAVVNHGFGEVVKLAAMLSVSLGIFNLFPIVPLDGGQMVMAVVEMLRRRRPSLRVQEIVTGIGFLLVVGLMACVWFIDIRRFAFPKDSGKSPAVSRPQQPAGRP